MQCTVHQRAVLICVYDMSRMPWHLNTADRTPIEAKKKNTKQTFDDVRLAVNEIAPMARDAAASDDKHLVLVLVLLDDAVALCRT